MTERILITATLHPQALQILQAGGAEAVYRPECARAMLLACIGEYHALITRSETTVDRELLSAGKQLKVVARAAVGVANIDLEYATQRGVLVLNTPGSNADSAAELTVALMLAAVRNIVPAHQQMQQRKWDRHRFVGQELRGKTLGLIGIGNVGQRVARICGMGLGMHVLAHDPYVSDDIFERAGAVKSDFKSLLARAEVISLHTPLNDETRHLLDAKHLGLLPQGAVVINAARGSLLELEALQRALESGQLSAAGIDTWPSEPPEQNPLCALPQVVMTPHLGASTEQAQLRVAKRVAEQTLRALRDEVVDSPVNMPRYQVIDDPRIKTYVVLAEKLGSFVRQSLAPDFNPHLVEVMYRGELSSDAGVLLRRAFLKGLLQGVVEETISFVNAEAVAAQRGLRVSEREDPHFSDYPSALKFVVSGAGRSFSIGGVVFGENNYRISLVDEFHFEVLPAKHLIYMQNEDRPGVIGQIGTLLGEFGVNINQFELSRNRLGGQAVSIFSVDTLPSAALKARLAETPHVISLKVISL